MSECIFCKIIKQEIPSDKVFENEFVYAFKDISPQAPKHIVLIPKKHIESLNALGEKDLALVGEIFSAIQKIVQEEKIAESGYRVVTNCGQDGGQTVDHLHFHLLGGRNLQWPPG